MYLPQGTALQNRYVIEGLLGHGGFGITYAAYDQSFGARVAIKEYLPRHLATRGEGKARVSVYPGEARRHFDYGLKKFMEEAQLLAQFAHHPNVVSARDYFEANGTAYMVMEYAEGVTLKEYLEKKGGRISFEEAKGIMMPVMDALREVHQVGLLHRDISPDNIYITTAAQVRVIDFGAARYFAGEQSKSLSVILKSGYAPEEQYRSSGNQGTWTDVYAVGATIYKCLTGQTPPDALDRMAGDTLEPPSRLGVAIPSAAEQALLQALAVNAGQRFQNMGEFQQALLGGAPKPGQFQPAPAPSHPAPKSSYAPGPAPVSASPPVLSQSSPPPSRYPQLPRRSANPAAIAAGIGIGIIGLILVAVIVLKYIRAPAAGTVSPQDQAEKYMTEGYAHFQKQEYDQAITSYQKAVQLEPRAATAYNMLGMAYRLKYSQLGTDKEIAAFKKAIEIDPRSWVPMINLGSTYYYMGEKAKAAPLFKKALEINPNHPEKSKILQMIAETQSGLEDNMRREVEKLAEKIRSAHLTKDINKWQSCYHSSYPNLGRARNQILELRKNYDIKEASYRISNVQRANDKQASTDIVWNIQLYDHRTHDYTLVRQSYKIVLEQGPGGWQIADSKELADVPVAPAKDGALMSMDAFTPLVQGYDFIREGKYEAANNQFVIAVNRDRNNPFALNNLAVLKERDGKLKDALIFLKDASLHANKYLDKVTQTCFAGGGSLAIKPLREKGDRSSIAPIIRENIYKLEAKKAALVEGDRQKEAEFREKLRLVEEERQAEAKQDEMRRKKEEEKREAEKREAEEREQQQNLQAERQRRMEEQQQQAQKMPSPDPSTSTQKGPLVLYAMGVALRTCPGEDCPVIEGTKGMKRNAEVEKVGQAENWFQVRVKLSGQIGWVRSRYLSAAPYPQ